MATNARMYVGNISFNATTSDLRDFFGDYKVTDVKIIMDRETQRPRGFAFVELENAADVAKAITSLDGTVMMGRTIRVSEAKERERSGGVGERGGGRPSNGRGGNGVGRSRRDDDERGWDCD